MSTPTLPWSIEGKICLVTGATSGIGRAIVEELARRGARVLAVARDGARGALDDEAARRLWALSVDLTSPQAAPRCPRALDIGGARLAHPSPLRPSSSVRAAWSRHHRHATRTPRLPPVSVERPNGRTTGPYGSEGHPSNGSSRRSSGLPTCPVTAPPPTAHQPAVGRQLRPLLACGRARGEPQQLLADSPAISSLMPALAAPLRPTRSCLAARLLALRGDKVEWRRRRCRLRVWRMLVLPRSPGSSLDCLRRSEDDFPSFAAILHHTERGSRRDVA